jgi:hypothetical protein
VYPARRQKQNPLPDDELQFVNRSRWFSRLIKRGEIKKEGGDPSRVSTLIGWGEVLFENPVLNNQGFFELENVEATKGGRFRLWFV